jgi:CRP-like cAMP-binding protein
MDTQEIIEIMHPHPFFSSWSNEAIKRLVEGCTLRVFNLGEVLWSVNTPGDSAYILLSGRIERVRIARPDEPKKEQFSAPGALLSLASMLQSWPHSSTATPLERTTVLELPRGHFELLFAQQDPVAFFLADAISGRVVDQMRDVNTRLHRVFGQPAETLLMLRRRLREDAFTSQDV